ncbi:helix-turn-helix domain-containing protein [Streptomyces arboris]|uniref:helix-turn-helix domain-containing protein n=1 Tax=Streptomyces arboris TaxID=2600619 RepID=UPI003BF5A247
MHLRVPAMPPGTTHRSGGGDAGDHTLGDLLRVCRSRLTPAEAGLRFRGGGRRTAGLRREEVSVLTGISVDYYSRLEQGRAHHPSRPSSVPWPGDCGWTP